MALPNHSKATGAAARRRVRELRSETSGSEKLLWFELRRDKLGFRFRRQHPVGPYVLDFYCSEARLAVEVDGEQHTPERDATRDKYMAELGITTMRIVSLELWDEKRSREIARDIGQVCRDLSGRNPFAEDSGTSP